MSEETECTLMRMMGAVLEKQGEVGAQLIELDRKVAHRLDEHDTRLEACERTATDRRTVLQRVRDYSAAFVLFAAGIVGAIEIITHIK